MSSPSHLQAVCVGVLGQPLLRETVPNSLKHQCTQHFFSACGIFLTSMHLSHPGWEGWDSPAENSLPGLCHPYRIWVSIHFSSSQHCGCPWNIILSSHTLRSQRHTLVLPPKSILTHEHSSLLYWTANSTWNCGADVRAERLNIHFQASNTPGEASCTCRAEGKSPLRHSCCLTTML